MELEAAEALVKAARPQAHPYIDCWRTVRARLVEARTEEVAHLARSRHASRVASRANAEEGDGAESDDDGGVADWLAAENMLIKETFQRQLTATLTLVTSLEGVHQAELSALSRAADGEATSVAEQIRSLREGREQERMVLERWVPGLDARGVVQAGVGAPRALPALCRTPFRPPPAHVRVQHAGGARDGARPAGGAESVQRQR